jgi:2-polyprenyl-3-methyl-5-hydroxy-6-metoxy-1,4-benzoquinol methylase
MKQRQLKQELMDDRTLDVALLHSALQGLKTINFLSASAASVWEPIERFARRTGRTRLRVLDVATGSGDIPIALWQRATRAGLQLDLHAVDFNENSLELGRREAERLGAKVRFEQLDVLQHPLPNQQDVVISSLFFHHLEEAAVIQLLRNMAAATDHLLLVNDLRRHWFGLLLAHVASRVLTISPIVRVDAIRSVKAAFTIPEMQVLAEAAGLQKAQFIRRWPCRFLLTWEKADQETSRQQGGLREHSRAEA